MPKHIGTAVIAAMLLVIICVILLSPLNNEVKGDLDREGIELRITTHLFSTQREMVKTLESKGFSITDKHEGFAVWSPHDNKCDIYALKPGYPDTKGMRTLGHELIHCIYGTFHKE